MLQAVEAVVRGGVVVPLEDYPLKEGEHYVLVPVPVPKRELSFEERMAAFDATCGKYRDSLSSVDAFIARKQEEKALERPIIPGQNPEVL